MCKKPSQEQPTILEVLQGQIGCVVPLRDSQSAKEQIKRQTVEAESKELRKFCSEEYELEASFDKEHA